MLDPRRKHWADVVQMLYKCFVFAGKYEFKSILWISIALTSIVVTELANTMKYGEGVLYNFVFTEFPFKTVSCDITAFHRIQ